MGQDVRVREILVGIAFFLGGLALTGAAHWMNGGWWEPAVIFAIAGALASLIVPAVMIERRRRHEKRLALAIDLCDRAASDAHRRGEYDAAVALKCAVHGAEHGRLPVREWDRANIAHRAYRDAQHDEDHENMARLSDELSAAQAGEVRFARARTTNQT